MKPTLAAWAITLGSAFVFACTDVIEVAKDDLTLRLAISAGDNQVAPAGTVLPLPLRVLVTNTSGQPVANVTVRWRVRDPDEQERVIEQVTRATGQTELQLSLSTTAGVHVITAALLPPFADSVRFQSIGQIQGATQMAAAPGDRPLADSVRATLAPYRVVVRDHLDRPVAGVRVEWRSVSGGGSLRAIESATDELGSAQMIHTLGDEAGTVHVTAAVPGLAGSPVQFTTLVTSGNPVSLRKNSGDQQIGEVGKAVNPYVAAVLDAYGNGVPGQPVDWAVVSGDGVLRNAASTTGPTGLAFAYHVLGAIDGEHRVTATASLLPDRPQVMFTSTAYIGTAIRVVSYSTWYWYYGYGELDSGFFDPSFVAINAGGAAIWFWRCDGCTGIPHQIVFEDDPDRLNGSPDQREGSWKRTFTAKGTYRYRCIHHSTDFASGMVGTVVVI